MKKIALGIVLLSMIFPAYMTAEEFEVKGNILLGVTPAEQVLDSAFKDSSKQFGGAYLLGDFSLSNEKLTAAGKIYYRTQATDSTEDAAQKLDLKRAYIRYRPFGNSLLEISGGKLYSYYLSGNYFQLAEIYTGASRWGKTGFGLKSEWNGFTFGLGLPVTESYAAYEKSFGLNGALSYDFAELNKDVPLKAGFDVCWNRTKTVTTDKVTKAESSEIDNDFSETFSLYYTPKLKGFFSKPAVTLSFSHNAEAYVASSVFKNVANYKSVGSADFVSLNFRGYFGAVQILAEGEAGKCSEGDIIPVYGGIQALIPVVDHLAFKPRIFFYGALDSEDSDNSRKSYEFYPRLWITSGQWIVSAGADFQRMQYAKDDWSWKWSIPLYVEYKVGK